jgi:hypothetical protein
VERTAIYPKHDRKFWADVGWACGPVGSERTAWSLQHAPLAYSSSSWKHVVGKHYRCQNLQRSFWWALFYLLLPLVVPCIFFIGTSCRVGIRPGLTQWKPCGVVSRPVRGQSTWSDLVVVMCEEGKCWAVMWKISSYRWRREKGYVVGGFYTGAGAGFFFL